MPKQRWQKELASHNGDAVDANTTKNNSSSRSSRAGTKDNNNNTRTNRKTSSSSSAAAATSSGSVAGAKKNTPKQRGTGTGKRLSRSKNRNTGREKGNTQSAAAAAPATSTKKKSSQKQGTTTKRKKPRYGENSARNSSSKKKTRVERDDASLLDTDASDDASGSNASITRDNNNSKNNNDTTGGDGNNIIESVLLKEVVHEKHPNSFSPYDEQVMYTHPGSAEGNKVTLRIFRWDKSTTKLCINTHSYLKMPKDCGLTLASGVCEVQRIIQKVVLHNHFVPNKKLFRGMWVFIRTKKMKDVTKPDTKYSDDPLEEFCGEDKVEENWILGDIVKKMDIKLEIRKGKEVERYEDDDDFDIDIEEDDDEVEEKNRKRENFHNWFYQIRKLDSYFLDLLVVVKDEDDTTTIKKKKASTKKGTSSSGGSSSINNTDDNDDGSRHSNGNGKESDSTIEFIELKRLKKINVTIANITGYNKDKTKLQCDDAQDLDQFTIDFNEEIKGNDILIDSNMDLYSFLRNKMIEHCRDRKEYKDQIAECTLLCHRIRTGARNVTLFRKSREIRNLLQSKLSSTKQSTSYLGLSLSLTTANAADTILQATGRLPLHFPSFSGHIKEKGFSPGKLKSCTTITSSRASKSLVSDSNAFALKLYHCEHDENPFFQGMTREIITSLGKYWAMGVHSKSMEQMNQEFDSNVFPSLANDCPDFGDAYYSTLLGGKHNQIVRGSYPPDAGRDDPPSIPIVQAKSVSTGEGLMAFAAAYTAARSPPPPTASAQPQALPPPQQQPPTLTPTHGDRPRTSILFFVRKSREENGKGLKQVLFAPRQIGYDSTVYDAMVKAQQKDPLLFMDDGTGDIQFSYTVDGFDLPLSYKKDSKDTTLLDLFSSTNDGKPFELSYTYDGQPNTILQLD